MTTATLKEVRNTGGRSKLFWQIDGLADSPASEGRVRWKGGRQAVKWMDGQADSQWASQADREPVSSHTGRTGGVRGDRIPQDRWQRHATAATWHSPPCVLSFAFSEQQYCCQLLTWTSIVIPAVVEQKSAPVSITWNIFALWVKSDSWSLSSCLCGGQRSLQISSLPRPISRGFYGQVRRWQRTPALIDRSMDLSDHSPTSTSKAN